MKKSYKEMPGKYARGNILGVGVHAIDMQVALAEIRSWIRFKTPNYICLTPAHAVMDCQDDPSLRKIYNASGLCTPDGMAIVWLLRLQGFRKVKRVYGADLMLAACEGFLKEGYRHFFYGGSGQTVEKLLLVLKKKFPELKIAGNIAPPFRKLSTAEEQTYMDQIKRSKADIVWVGLGSPKQEMWMSRHVKELKLPVLIGVGAAFDFIAGTKPQAPRWMQCSGLEWLFRLLSEPRRLWKRYIKYPRFAWLAVLQLLRIKKYKLE